MRCRLLGVSIIGATLLQPSPAPSQILRDSTAPPVTAEVFAPGIVSTSAHEFGLTVTSDWSELFFTRQIGGRSEIMVAHRTGSGWSEPRLVSFDTDGTAGHPWLAPDGERLLFVSRARCPGAAEALNLWMVERADGGWSEARCSGPPFNRQTVHAASISGSGTVYGARRTRSDPRAPL